MHRTRPSSIFTFVVAVAALLVVTLGCGLDKLRSATNPPPTRQDNRATMPNFGTPAAKGDPMFQTEAQLHGFVDALTSAVGSDNPNLLKLSFYDQYAMAEVQDPAKPENVDGYTWRDGKLSPPNPVKIIGNGKISDNVFALKDVNLDGLPDLSREILDKLKDVEGGHLTGYSISRGLPFTKDIQIQPLADATRKSVYVMADKNAKIKKFEVK